MMLRARALAGQLGSVGAGQGPSLSRCMHDMGQHPRRPLRQKIAESEAESAQLKHALARERDANLLLQGLVKAAKEDADKVKAREAELVAELNRVRALAKERTRAVMAAEQRVRKIESANKVLERASQDHEEDIVQLRFKAQAAAKQMSEELGLTRAALMAAESRATRMELQALRASSAKEPAAAKAEPAIPSSKARAQEEDELEHSIASACKFAEATVDALEHICRKRRHEAVDQEAAAHDGYGEGRAASPSQSEVKAQAEPREAKGSPEHEKKKARRGSTAAFIQVAAGGNGNGTTSVHPCAHVPETTAKPVAPSSSGTAGGISASAQSNCFPSAADQAGWWPSASVQTGCWPKAPEEEAEQHMETDGSASNDASKYASEPAAPESPAATTTLQPLDSAAAAIPADQAVQRASDEEDGLGLGIAGPSVPSSGETGGQAAAEPPVAADAELPSGAVATAAAAPGFKTNTMQWEKGMAAPSPSRPSPFPPSKKAPKGTATTPRARPPLATPRNTGPLPSPLGRYQAAAKASPARAQENEAIAPTKSDAGNRKRSRPDGPEDGRHAARLQKPFKLATEERGAQYQQALAAQLEAEEKAARLARIPRAQGVPLTTDAPVVQPKPAPRKLTVPQPFGLETEARHERTEEQRRQEREAEEAAIREAAAFKVHSLRRSAPFHLQDFISTVTVPKDVPLHTRDRAAGREAFNKYIEDKQKEAEAAAKLAAEAARQAEEEERKRLRMKAMFKAAPVPDFSAAPVTKPMPVKPLTTPVSPRLGQSKRPRADQQ